MLGKIKTLIGLYSNISFVDVEDSGEGTLVGISFYGIDTTKFTEDEYNEWENFLNAVNIIHDNFQIYCSFDTSGRDWWNGRNESNYTYIDLWYSENFSDNDFAELIKALGDLVLELKTKFENENI